MSHLIYYKVCECGTNFTSKRDDAIFCSAKCRMAQSRKNAQSKKQANELTLNFEQAMAIGEIGEINPFGAKRIVALMGQQITSKNMDELIDIIRQHAHLTHIARQLKK